MALNRNDKENTTFDPSIKSIRLNYICCTIARLNNMIAYSIK